MARINQHTDSHATADQPEVPRRTPEAAWRHACADWIMDMLASPAAYLRRLENVAAMADAKHHKHPAAAFLWMRGHSRDGQNPDTRAMVDEYATLAFDRRLARRGTNRDDFLAALEDVRQYLLSLVPGVSPVQLAHEMAEPGNQALMRELSQAGWMPAHPADAQRKPKDDAARMAKAEALADSLVPDQDPEPAAKPLPGYDDPPERADLA